MIDPLTWSPIHLGRWFGTQVRVHILLIVFVVLRLLSAAVTKQEGVNPPLPETACWLVLLLAALALHELGHVLAAARLGYEPDEVRLWPLGNMMTPSIAARSTDHPAVILAGPAVNLSIVVASAIGLYVFGHHAHFVWHPFHGSGVPDGAKWALTDGRWWIGWFGHLNWLLFLANLIPALPFDNGRLLRGYVAKAAITSTKDSMIGPWTAHTSAALLALIGLVRLVANRGGEGLLLIGLALLIEVMVRAEMRLIEDGGFYDDGVFGYDFSEGYTSLEGNAAKVRPYRESALKRWRRRRSDHRRQRRLAREAAEEARMDEILEKVHREGRAALTDEETRFLIRVSAKYRNRPKTS